jgi:hypothetical protein
MSAGELAWRAQGFMRDRLDRPRIALGMIPRAQYDAAAAERILAGGLPLCDHATKERDADTPPFWRERLLRRADALLDHRFSFFSLDDRHLGDPIDWNRDHESGAPTPRAFAASIDYRDVRIAGDAKVVWEPARHHQLIVLGRAYRASGDARYAREVVAQAASWLDQCPFGTGMHWRSPLELAIRAINWVWAFDLIRPAGALHGAAAARLLNALHLHVWDIARKYSRGSSANNHLIGEAAGVFIASTCLPGLTESVRWLADSRRILEEEIHAQTYADGGSREQAFGYHVFVLQFLVLAAVAAKRSGVPFSAAFHERLQLMLDFAGAMAEGGTPPLYGDADDGYVADLGGDGREAREWVIAGKGLLGASDHAWDANVYGETAYWLLGSHTATSAATVRPLASRAFPESGRYLLQHGTQGGAGAVSVQFDCGDFGFGAIAAHGHADALAFTLRVSGTEVLIDPGTYDYFRFPEWRDYFRSTSAHNTVAVDRSEQSVAIGPFMWGVRARSACTAWEPRPDGGRVEGTHDGYARLADPVQHVRSIDLDAARRVLTIVDRLVMTGEHTVDLYFHFSEHCKVHLSGSAMEATGPFGSVRFEHDARLTSALLQGSTAPIGGWVSRAYHRKVPCTTAVLSGRFQGNTSLVTRIRLGLHP